MQTMPQDQFVSANSLEGQPENKSKNAKKGFIIAGGLVTLGALGVIFRKPIGKLFNKTAEDVSKKGDEVIKETKNTETPHEPVPEPTPEPIKDPHEHVVEPEAKHVEEAIEATENAEANFTNINIDKNLETILGDCKDERVVDKIKRSQAKIAKALSEETDDLAKYKTYIRSIDDMDIVIDMGKQEKNDSIVGALKRYQDSMKNDLKNMGVEEIDASIGSKWDMKRHCVTETRPTDNPELVDTIAEIFRPGFIKDGIGIRLPEVIVYRAS